MALSNVDWLLHEATVERPLAVSQRMDIDNEFWRAKFERLELGPGLRVFLTDAEVHQELTVQPRDAETEPWIANNIAVAGRIDVEMPDGQKTRVGPDQAIMFRPSQRNPKFRH